MIVPGLELITPTGTEYTELVRECAAQGLTAGRVHDALHVRGAIKAGADRIHTLNVRDFRSLAPGTWQSRISAP